MSDFLWPHGLQHARLHSPPTSPGVCSNSCPLSQWGHPTNHLILCCLLLLLPSIFSSIRVFFPWVSSSHQVAKVMEFKLQRQSFKWICRADFLAMKGNQLVGSPCSPRDSRGSSPTPQFKSINSSVLSFLYSTTLTSIHGYWKKHSFD